VESIDIANRRVGLRRGRDLAFDALVVALGASLDSTLVSGLQEALHGPNAGQYYTLDGAVEMRHKLRHFDHGKICVLVSRTPFRCPAAPYEGALLLADLCVERGIRDDVQIDVFTPEGLPMTVAGPAVGQELVTLLAQRGILFRPKMEVQVINAQSQELAFASGEHVTYDFLVAIPPHRAPRPVAETGLGPQGWIPVDRTTLRSAVEGVWAIGDVAAVPLVNGLFLPKAAVFAEGESEVVAAEVARHLGYEIEPQGYTGKGGCWVEVGNSEAAYGAGNFFAEPSPLVELQPPSGEHHKEKEQQERSWIEEWNRDHAGQPASAG